MRLRVPLIVVAALLVNILAIVGSAAAAGVALYRGRWLIGSIDLSLVLLNAGLTTTLLKSYGEATATAVLEIASEVVSEELNINKKGESDVSKKA